MPWLCRQIMFSHWNTLGALTAADGIMSALGRDIDVHENDVLYLTGAHKGDLTRILFPSESIAEECYVMPYDTDGLRFIQPSSIDGSRDSKEIMADVTGTPKSMTLLSALPVPTRLMSEPVSIGAVCGFAARFCR